MQSKADRQAAAKKGWEKRRARAVERAARRLRRSEAAQRGWETRRAGRISRELAGELDEFAPDADLWPFELGATEEVRFGDEKTIIVEDPIVRTLRKKRAPRRETRPGKGRWR